MVIEKTMQFTDNFNKQGLHYINPDMYIKTKEDLCYPDKQKTLYSAKWSKKERAEKWIYWMNLQS